MTKTKRAKDVSKSDLIIERLNKHIYLETFLLTLFFLAIGYIISPSDICLIEKNTPYLIVFIAVITLFHGFESAFIATFILSIAMWIFYPQFPYNHFLTLLLMGMLFSEFHYFWTKKIRELKIDNDYKSQKLNELSKAFYTLKISHDQLEKNYVLKPMSIRNAIEEIGKKEKKDIFPNFLYLLEKSFNLSSGFIVYKDDIYNEDDFDENNSSIRYTTTYHEYKINDLLNEYLIERAFQLKQPIYISDVSGNPNFDSHQNSNFLAVLPAIYNKNIVAFLVIEDMPFMSFNRENLISIAILLEYITINFHKNKLLQESKEMLIFKDSDFRYEYLRLWHLYQKYKTDSTFLIFKNKSELKNYKLYNMISNMLRSLDLVTLLTYNNIHFTIILFPINGASVATGFLNRLENRLKDDDKLIEDYITVSIKKPQLILEYILGNYEQ